MKLRTNIANRRRRAGVTLIECLVYIAVFSVLTSIAMASFYFCWDHTRATVFAADEVENTLRAGEAWRADVRAATGKISVVNTPTGETVRIPIHGRDVLYRFADGQLWREVPAQKSSRLLLPKVKTSEMKTEARDGVAAWRWELEATPRRKEAHFLLMFTFEAAQTRS